MSNYKKLVKNSAIFAIANLGTKLLSIILVPFYTYVLTTKQYGTVDLLITTVSLLLPIISLSIFDSVLRFAMDKKYDPKKILTSSIVVSVIGFVITLLFYPVLKRIGSIGDYVFIFYLVLMVQLFNSVFSQFVRGLGHVKLFALNGVVNTLVMLVCNILFLAKFKMGIMGYLLSIFIANVVSNLMLMYYGKILSYFKLSFFDKNLTKEMLDYSMPLIPNSLMWWIMNVSDRYIISIVLGFGANGIYAVANKIPTLLNVLNNIFFQAWQMSAIEEAESEDKGKFYTNVFNVFASFMFLATSGIIIFLKLILENFLATSYADSWKYVPFLLLAIVFSSFSGFLGTNYIAMKNTKGVLKTSIIGAIINFLINILFIKKIGLHAATISTMISYFVLWIIRAKDTKEFIDIKVNKMMVSITIILLFIQIGILYLTIKYSFILQVVLFACILGVNISSIKPIIEAFMKKIKRK